MNGSSDYYEPNGITYGYIDYYELNEIKYGS